MNKKITNLARLKKILAKNKGKTVVFTNGCFDILHVGHIRYLAGAKQKGDILIVGLNSDASVKKIKGKDRPINTQQDRAEVLAAIESVDFVTIFCESTPLNLIKAIKPDVLVKGGDWQKDKIVGSAQVLSRCGKVFVIPYIRGRSTTNLIKKIQKNQ